MSLKEKIRKKICHKDEEKMLRLFKSVLKNEKTILDVGCGSCKFSNKIQKRFNVKLRGIDIVEPKEKIIKFDLFDGETIPFKDNAFDAVLFVNVLHHTDTQNKLIKEALRVSKKSVFIKDHYYENKKQLFILKTADKLGNFLTNTKTPFLFKSLQDWDKLVDENNGEKILWKSKLTEKIYIPQIMVKLNK